MHKYVQDFSVQARPNFRTNNPVLRHPSQHYHRSFNFPPWRWSHDVKRLLEDKTAEPTAFGTYGDAEDDSELDAKEAEGVEDPTLGIPSSVPRHSDHFHLEEDGGEIELKSEALLDVLSEAPRPLARKATMSTVASDDSDGSKEDRIGRSYDIWDLYS